MESDLSFLELMSELLVAIAGFSVLLFALRRGEGPRALFRAHATVGSAFLALGMSLVPQVLGRIGVAPESVWPISYVLGVVFVGPFTAVMYARHRVLWRLGFQTQRGSAVYPRIAYTCGIAATAICLVSAAQWTAAGAEAFHMALTLFSVWPVMAIVASFAVEWHQAIGELRAASDSSS